MARCLLVKALEHCPSGADSFRRRRVLILSHLAEESFVAGRLVGWRGRRGVRTAVFLCVLSVVCVYGSVCVCVCCAPRCGATRNDDFLGWCMERVIFLCGFAGVCGWVGGWMEAGSSRCWPRSAACKEPSPAPPTLVRVFVSLDFFGGTGEAYANCGFAFAGLGRDSAGASVPPSWSTTSVGSFDIQRETEVGEDVVVACIHANFGSIPLLFRPSCLSLSRA